MASASAGKKASAGGGPGTNVTSGIKSTFTPTFGGKVKRGKRGPARRSARAR